MLKVESVESGVRAVVYEVKDWVAWQLLQMAVGDRVRLIEFNIQNRDGQEFHLRHYYCGGELGSVIYPDGLIERAGSKDLLKRYNLKGRLVDRIEAGKPRPGYQFLSPEEYSVASA